jgi:hypothetical protein
VRIDRFALTANNVTYGVMGDAMSYWRFFPPSEDGWGRVPAWGVGEVLETGALIYGPLPMASSATLALDDRLVERSPHRAELPATYNRYIPVDPEAPHLDEMLLLRPLFGTSFLLADFLGGDGDGTVVLGSASSKTAYGLAFLLSQRVVGLTSARNREFTESLGLYDRVLTYDEVDGLAEENGPIVFVDMSGDGAVRDGVRGAAGDRLRRDVVVGATHWERIDTGAAGTGRELFFAPSHVEQMTERLGADEMRRRMGEAWEALMARVGDWIEIERASGPDALGLIWRALVDGEADPRRGYVVRLD